MSQTPVSGLTPYCTGAQFLVRYRIRTVAQLLSDTDVAIPLDQVANNPRLLTFLKQNSGKLEAAIFAGQRYTPDDLNAIITNPANNNQVEMLAGVVADLTIVDLYRANINMTMPKLPQVEESQALLEAFARGERIFSLPNQIAAGREEPQTEQLVDVENRNGATWQARRYFGRRSRWQGVDGGDTPLDRCCS